MKKTITIYSCDICGKKVGVTKIKYPVMFHTTQSDGMSCKPYIAYKEIDVCGDCMAKTIMIDGYGAQGYHTYKIKKSEEE